MKGFTREDLLARIEELTAAHPELDRPRMRGPRGLHEIRQRMLDAAVIDEEGMVKSWVVGGDWGFKGCGVHSVYLDRSPFGDHRSSAQAMAISAVVFIAVYVGSFLPEA